MSVSTEESSESATVTVPSGSVGNSFVAAVEFGPTVRAKAIMTGGESGDPSSPHFTDQASIFDHASLAGFAADVGLDRDEALAVLAGDQYAQAVEADEQVAYSLGVSGVPFFVIDRRYGISGAQPAETITQVLERVWAETEAA